MPDPGSENGPWWEQPALSIHFCLLVCEFSGSWLNKVKTKKDCLTKHKTTKTHQFVPLRAQGMESDEIQQGLLFWQEKPKRT